MKEMLEATILVRFMVLFIREMNSLTVCEQELLYFSKNRDPLIN